MSAPGTLSDDDQRVLMAKLLQLIHAAYGEDIQIGLTVMRHLQNDGRPALAVYSMGTFGDQEALAKAFAFAAYQLHGSEVRLTTIETEPETKQ